MAQRTNTDLPPELLEHMAAIKAKALEYGLDFYEVVFEVVDFETMNQLAAYGGFPTRYPHWRWGMEFEKLSKRDAYGLGRIYEMVINNDPCYAYLQESNSVTDQKLVMAHVYGHADFFKNNAWFAHTDRKMIDRMANHATRVRRHAERHGADTVERFLDVCLSLEHLIDPHSPFVRREPTRAAAAQRDDADHAPKHDPFAPDKFPAKDYMDPFINPREALAQERAARMKQSEEARRKFPSEPTRDVLLFLLRHAPLEDWRQDILSIVRDEAYYYAPQAMTKIMNEGWASYWHSKLMTRHFATDAEIVQYADQHSGVVFQPPGGFNPYKIGIELFRDIERRWDKGHHGASWERLEGLGARRAHDDQSMKGRDKIFEVRRVYNDVNFIDEFLTEEFVDEHKMFMYQRDEQTGRMKRISREFTDVKRALLNQLTNMGQPFIYVVDANYLNRGELYLAHKWTGAEIDVAKAIETMRNLRRLWDRPVRLQARVGDETHLFTLSEPDGEIKKGKVNDDTPPPAHAI